MHNTNLYVFNGAFYSYSITDIDFIPKQTPVNRNRT